MNGTSTPLTQPAKYLFLDFDGVTHYVFPVAGVSDPDNAYFAFLPAIEAVLRTKPYPVQIVISSSWRENRGLAELRAYFASDLRDRVIGVTPEHNDGLVAGGRLGEILAWLDRHDPGAPWVAVDDLTNLFAVDEDRAGERSMDALELSRVVALVHCEREFFDEQAAADLQQALDDPKTWARYHPVPVVED